MDGDDGSTDTLADQFDNVVGAASDENLRQEIDELVDGDDDALPSAVNGERDEHFERPYDHDDDLSGGSVADSGSSGTMGGGGEADAAGSTLVAALSEAAAADAGVAPDAPDSMLRPLEEFYRQAIMSSSGRFPSKVRCESAMPVLNLLLLTCSLAHSLAHLLATGRLVVQQRPTRPALLWPAALAVRQEDEVRVQSQANRNYAEHHAISLGEQPRYAARSLALARSCLLACPR